MQYRKFGRLDWHASALGFGCMRLPVLNGQYDKVDFDTAIPLIRKAIDNGVNYYCRLGSFDPVYGSQLSFTGPLDFVATKAMFGASVTATTGGTHSFHYDGKVEATLKSWCTSYVCFERAV